MDHDNKQELYGKQRSNSLKEYEFYFAQASPEKGLEDRIQEIISEKGKCRLMDIGCGNAEALSELKEKFAGKALLYIDVSVEGQSFMESIGELKTLHENRKSIAGMGLQLLEKNLAQTSFTSSFSAEELFRLLSEGEIDRAVDMLTEK